MRRLVTLSIAAATAVSLAAIPAVQSASAKPAPLATKHKSVAASATSVARAKLQAIRKAHLAGQPVSKGSSSRLSAAASMLTPKADGTVRVTVSGDATAVGKAVHDVHGRSYVSSSGETSVSVAKNQLGRLAAAPGVLAVEPAHLAYETSGSSEAVSLSGAQNWTSVSGKDGTGVKVAIVDLGFGNISTEIAANHLAANQADPVHLFNEDCDDIGQTQHGTAVAEIVHQMAPGAELFLICVQTSTGFNHAVNDILTYNNQHPTAPVTIATSSLGFPNDSRGDGSDPGDPTNPSTAASVETARKAGILWVQSAGNQVGEHWGGALADANGNGIIDLHTGPQNNFEDDVIALAPGSTGAEIDLQFDQWPSSSAHLAIDVIPFVCPASPCQGVQNGQEVQLAQVAGHTPTISMPVPANGLGQEQFYDVAIVTDGSFPHGARYDLNYYGDLDGISASACPQAPDPCVIPAQSYSQSISAPAYSPFALAVGAHDQADGQSNSLEFFSSQGPTIDGRVKPDITGWDGTSSFLPDFTDGFFGTSAAAPHVAGAAALVKAQRPSWEASQIQNFLEQRANSGSPSNPPTNQRGFGLLTMGDPTTAALPAQGQYQAISPVRVLDTRSTLGGHPGKLGAGGLATVDLSSGVGALPSDATAVAINLTGIRASTGTFLSVFPGGTTWPGTSNLNLATPDTTAAVFAIVSVNTAKSIIVRNTAGLIDVAIDEVGFFRTNTVTGGLYTALPAANRVLDTRNNTGGHFGKLSSTGTVEVNTQAPAGSTAAIVNITSADAQTSSGLLAAAPTCSTATSTLNYNLNPRANLAIVGLDGSGRFCLSNSSKGTVDAVVDVLGFMGTNGATYVGLPSPRRIMDTRTGNGPVPVKPIAGGHSDVITSGTSEIPGELVVSGSTPTGSHTVALFTGVTEASATIGGYLQAFAGTTRPVGLASTLNFSKGRVIPNAAVVGLNNLQFSVFNSSGSTAVLVDLFGYFVTSN